MSRQVLVDPLARVVRESGKEPARSLVRIRLVALGPAGGGSRRLALHWLNDTGKIRFVLLDLFNRVNCVDAACTEFRATLTICTVRSGRNFALNLFRVEGRIDTSNKSN